MTRKIVFNTFLTFFEIIKRPPILNKFRQWSVLIFQNVIPRNPTILSIQSYNLFWWQKGAYAHVSTLRSFNVYQHESARTIPDCACSVQSFSEVRIDRGSGDGLETFQLTRCAYVNGLKIIWHQWLTVRCGNSVQTLSEYKSKKFWSVVC